MSRSVRGPGSTRRGCSDRQIDRNSDAYSPTARFVATTAKCAEAGPNGCRPRARPGVRLFTTVAQHTRGILERDAEALAAVVSVLHSSSRPLLYASAAEDAGGELSRAQRNAEALEQMNAAFDTYIECEAIADARRVGRALRRLGMERRVVTHPRARAGWDSLTDSELTVVHLIAEGATNRSVAEQLQISPHTVKTHLHNAFAKLGVTSRAQLTRLMNRSD